MQTSLPKILSRSQVQFKGGCFPSSNLPKRLQTSYKSLWIHQKQNKYLLNPIFCTLQSESSSDQNKEKDQTKQVDNEISKTEVDQKSEKRGFANVIAGLMFALQYIRNIPQRWKQIRKLRKASNDNPEDADKHGEFLTALNKSSNPSEVISRVESGKYASNSVVVVEYMKALVQSNRIMEYTGTKPFSVEQEHRSLARLLEDMKRGVEGETAVEQAGYTSRNPLYIQVQNSG
eukprot:TRINITY_DN7687_c0_g1_i3.p1 TRINITY_DN7687_c0_g1~~TRINITY_DN7687_c0_g1_i3.p1  ORF type:complete len:232 (-),score=29.25 TRINITY_DN7687_c0_g1_i3:65-760(-)